MSTDREMLEDAAKAAGMTLGNEYLARNGIHTCHAECQRPLCKLTRERDALLEALKAIVAIDAHSALTEAEADQIDVNARAAIKAVEEGK